MDWCCDAVMIWLWWCNTAVVVLWRGRSYCSGETHMRDFSGEISKVGEEICEEQGDMVKDNE